MITLIEWLLGLTNIRLGRDAPLLLKWSRPVEAWMVFGFALAAVTAIGLIYWRERTSPGRRIALAVVRCAIVAFTVVVVAGPVLVLQRNRVEPSYVALALDRSLSMGAADQYGDASLARSVAAGAGLPGADRLPDYSRLDLVKRALTRGEAAGLRKLLDHNGVQFCTFAGGVETVGFFASHADATALIDSVRDVEADGVTTDLAGAISHIVSASQGPRLAGIVLASDGQATQPTSLKDALDLARDRRVPIYPIRLGWTRVAPDIGLGPAPALDAVFADDLLAVEVSVYARGLTEPTMVAVRFVDPRAEGRPSATVNRTGTVRKRASPLATEEVVLDPSHPQQTVELRVKLSEPGRRRYRVEVEAIPVDPSRPKEARMENNTQPVEVTVLDKRLRVLYVDAYPRYEYRYLKNALARESLMDLSVLLLEADEAFVQEGTVPIRRFPETPEELNRFDVVLFGDVDPRAGWLSIAQMNMLLDFVGHGGGGFGLIAGERAAPHRFLGTPLEKLIPIRIDPTFLGRYDHPLTAGFHPRLTRDGRSSRLFRFHADRAQSLRLFDALPPLYWFARTLGPKPGATVLAEHPTVENALGPMPLVVTGRYGAGRLFFQATDDTWRWRRHTNELLHDAYWIQVVRELMRGTRVARNRRFMILTDRRTYPYAAPVRVDVTILDTQLLAQQRDVIHLAAEPTAPPSHPAAPTSQPTEPLSRPTHEPSRDRLPFTRSVKGEGADLPPEPTAVKAVGSAAGITNTARKSARSSKPNGDMTASAIARFDVFRLSNDSNRFEGRWVPPRPGTYTVTGPELESPGGEPGSSAVVRVEPPDLEGRRPEANHEVLERIATATNGRMIELDELEAAFASIPNRSVRIPDDIVAPLWDSKLVFLLFALMISIEWALRKAFGLL